MNKQRLIWKRIVARSTPLVLKTILKKCFKNYQMIVIMHASVLTVNGNCLEAKEEEIVHELFWERRMLVFDVFHKFQWLPMENTHMEGSYLYQ